MVVPLILLIGMWVTAMFFAGWMFSNKEVDEDNRDYYERHNQPNPADYDGCLLYTSPSPRDRQKSRMPSSA